MMRHTTPRRQTGFTLIEVLVAVLIFSFGLLGFVGLQARAIQYSTNGEDSNRAALLANEISTAIVLSPSAATGVASAPDAVYGAWQTRVSTPASGGLPNGSGTVVTSAASAAITITWRSTNAASSSTPNQYVTQVFIP